MSLEIANALDYIEEEAHLLANLGRVGLVTTQAATNARYECAAEIVHRACKKTQGSFLVCVYGPQHGYTQTEQDNMIETPDSTLQLADGTVLPLISLYSGKIEEYIKTLQTSLDTLLIDLQDIGCRTYTYMQTLAVCLQAFHNTGKRVIVLDRYNPLGLVHFDKKEGHFTYCEGNILDLRWNSLVGWFAIPLRHGLTLGELGRFYLIQNKLDVKYHVLKVKNLQRNIPVKNLSNLAPWTLPSPNIPTWISAFFFPAFVSLEATNVSEGRGTTQPFQTVGAPWLDAQACLKFLQTYAQNNTSCHASWVARTHAFRPTFNKHAGIVCQGLSFYPLEAHHVHTFDLGMYFLYFCATNHGNSFAWNSAPYEYNAQDPRLNLILGNAIWLEFFEKARGCSPLDFLEELQNLLTCAYEEAQAFAHNSQEIWLY